MSQATAGTRIQEDVFSGDLKIDRDQSIIRNVKILGRESKNGRVYSQAALEQAMKLYDGCDVCLDHPSDSSAERSIRDSIGVLKQIRITQEGVFGDLHYLKSHRDAEAIAERAERFPGSFGLSHNAYGELRPASNDGPSVVESIEYVESVDIVRKPATNRGLFESHRKETETVSKKKVKDILAEQKKSAEAKRLLKLLEMEGMPAEAATAEVPTNEGDAETQLKASVEAMVVAVIRDDKATPQEKLAKIRQILNVQDKVMGAGAGGSGEGSGGGEGSGEVPESQKADKQIQQLLRREKIRDLLESNGLSWAKLDAAKKKLLDKAADGEVMEALVEGWKGDAKETDDDYEDRSIRKPKISSVRESHTGSESYDDLKKDAMSGARRTSKAS